MDFFVFKWDWINFFCIKTRDIHFLFIISWLFCYFNVNPKMLHAIQNMIKQSFLFLSRKSIWFISNRFIRFRDIIRFHPHLMLKEVLNGFQHLPLGLKPIFDRCFFKFLTERNKHGWGNKSSKNIIKISCFFPSLISNMHFVRSFF